MHRRIWSIMHHCALYCRIVYDRVYRALSYMIVCSCIIVCYRVLSYIVVHYHALLYITMSLWLTPGGLPQCVCPHHSKHSTMYYHVLSCIIVHYRAPQCIIVHYHTLSCIIVYYQVSCTIVYNHELSCIIVHPIFAPNGPSASFHHFGSENYPRTIRGSMDPHGKKKEYPGYGRVGGQVSPKPKLG